MSAGPVASPQRTPVWRDGVAGALAVGTLLLGAVFVLADLAVNGGALVAPLDDAYIHLQYGAQLGRGHLLEYHTGDAASTGASSLLYVLILGAASALGLEGSLLGFAVGLGIACLAGTVVLVHRLGSLLLGPAVGIWSAVLVAASGPLLWGAASGMEIGLTALLLVATLYAFTHERSGGWFVVTPLLGALLALARTEGLILAAAVCVAMVWTVTGAWRAGRCGRPRALGAAALALLPIAAGAAQDLTYLLLSGSATASGVRAKSLLYDQPQFFFGGVVDRTVANLRGLVDALNALNYQSYAFPGALVLAVAGLGYLLVARPAWRALAAALGAGLATVLVAISTLSTALSQELRYVQPFLPVLLLLAVCGVYALTRLLARERQRRVALHTALVVALLFTLLALPSWVVNFARQAATIRTTDVSMAIWIRDNLPAEAVVAVKDVGAVSYLGGRRTVDLVGLTTAGLAEPSNHGTGALYEALQRLPPGQRPGYFAVYDPPPGPPMLPLVEAGVLDEDALARFEVHRPDQLPGPSVVPFDRATVYRADWGPAGSGDRRPPGCPDGARAGYLDVADLASEAAHGYRARMARAGLQPQTVLRRQGSVVDSGRTIVGGERFTVGGLEPGRPLTICSRLRVRAAEGEQRPQRRVRVTVDGAPVGVWRHRSPGRVWSTATFTVPGSAITSAQVTVELEPVRPLLGPYPDYTSYGYWFAS